VKQSSEFRRACDVMSDFSNSEDLTKKPWYRREDTRLTVFMVNGLRLWYLGEDSNQLMKRGGEDGDELVFYLNDN